MRDIFCFTNNSSDIAKSLEITAKSKGKALNQQKTMWLKVEEKVFPDGEIEIRLPVSVNEIEAFGPLGKIFILTRLNNHNDLVRLCLLLNALKPLKAKDVLCFIPYLLYGRSDKEAKGLAVGLDMVIDILRGLGCDKIVTVNLHSWKRISADGNISEPYYDRYLPYRGLLIKNISIGRLFLKGILHAKKNNFIQNVRNLILVALDAGAESMVKLISEKTNCPYILMNKYRDRGNVWHQNLGDKLSCVKKRDIIIIDDIAASGASLVSALRELKRRTSSSSIGVFVSHCLDQGLAASATISKSDKGVCEKHWMRSFDYIITTNSITEKYQEGEGGEKLFCLSLAEEINGALSA